MIPTQTKNPKGLHCRYIVKHIDGSPTYNCPEYFVLRLDNRSENKAHVEACRLAVLAYADAIAATEPELAEDIYKRYNKSVVDNKTKLKPEYTNICNTMGAGTDHEIV